MIDVKKLQETLSEVIADANTRKRTFENKFKKLMSDKYNISIGDSADILNGKIPVEAMSVDLMYKIIKAFYEIHSGIDNGFSTSKLDVNKYFTAEEQSKFSEKIPDEDKIEDIIITNDWYQIAPDQYSFSVPIEEVLRWRNTNRIRYNERTQRRMTIVDRGNVVYKKVTLNEQALKEIKELMENDDYIPDLLILNINPEFYELPKVVRGNLIIPKESTIDMTDGFHRYIEMTDVKMLMPSWNIKIQFNLTVFNEEKANKFILQLDKKTHLSDEQVTAMDKYDPVNYLLDTLNKSRKFLLKGTLADTTSTYSSVNKIIHRLFNINETKDGVPVREKIEEDMNSLVESKKYYDKDFTKEEWFIYLYIIKYSIDNKMEFMDLIEKIDLNELLNNISFKNEPTVKQYKYMDEVMKNV